MIDAEETDGLASSGQRHDTVMWEVRAAPGRLAELLEWVRGTAVPELLDTPACLQVDVYDAADERVVVIARFAGTPARPPEPPAGLLRRPAHVWPFRHLSAYRAAHP